METDLSIRPATPKDAELIHSLIVALAVYEREPNAVQTTPEVLAAQLSESPLPFECLIAEVGGVPAGFALFFHNYSTWRGQRGLYLEDLFVVPEQRGRGIGKALLQRLATIAVERRLPRMDWAVLNWNTPAIDFYHSLGAVPMSEWTVYRLTGESLEQLAR